MKKLTFEEAKELSLLKWDYFHKHTAEKFEESQLYKDLKHLLYDCGLCEYHSKGKIRFPNCKECEFNQGYEDGCMDDGHIFYRWNATAYDNDLLGENILIAAEIYRLIERLEPNEFSIKKDKL